MSETNSTRRCFSPSFSSPNLQLVLINNAKTIVGYREFMKGMLGASLREVMHVAKEPKRKGPNGQ